MIDYLSLQQSFHNNEFFKDKQWESSPSPLSLPTDIAEQIVPIGNACFDFLKSISKLYYASKNNKTILRNKDLILPWIAEYFNRGKTDLLLKHLDLNNTKHAIPQIIRPDLLLTDDGLAMTELEVVPGGIGFTSFLHSLYENNDSNLIGSSSDLLNGFYDTLANLTKHNPLPVIAILVSDESETYLPEFIWLAKQLSSLGKKVYCINPNTLYYENSKLKAPVNQASEIIEIDIIYRFFELFDLHNIPTASIIIQAIENQTVTVSPPFNPIFEEKLCMALFHHYQLEDFWQESLPKQSFQILKKIIPQTWIIDPQPFGPNAILNGPFVNGKPLSSWLELTKATQKNRNFIIKRSGYNEDAWGARSVTLGNDCSQEDWANKLQLAIQESQTAPFIIQEFKKPKKITHPIYNTQQTPTETDNRVRLCPYYMKNADHAEIKGILATLCPADKKIIHGMTSATFVPCALT